MDTDDTITRAAELGYHDGIDAANLVELDGITARAILGAYFYGNQAILDTYHPRRPYSGEKADDYTPADLARRVLITPHDDLDAVCEAYEVEFYEGFWSELYCRCENVMEETDNQVIW